MNKADKLLLKHGYDVTGNYTGKRVEILTKKQKRKRKSKPLINIRKKVEKSEGEVRIAKFLSENNIRFKSEHWDIKCYNWRNNHVLFFDFYLPDYNAVIEFDGKHHYKPIYGEKKLQSTKFNDWVKNKFCEIRGILMLRISCFDTRNIDRLFANGLIKNSAKSYGKRPGIFILSRRLFARYPVSF